MTKLAFVQVPSQRSRVKMRAVAPPGKALLLTSFSARGDAVVHFLLDPGHRMRWSPYAGGGVGARRDGSADWRGVAIFVAGVNGLRWIVHAPFAVTTRDALDKQDRVGINRANSLGKAGDEWLEIIVNEIRRMPVPRSEVFGVLHLDLSAIIRPKAVLLPQIREAVAP